MWKANIDMHSHPMQQLKSQQIFISYYCPFNAQIMHTSSGERFWMNYVHISFSEVDHQEVLVNSIAQTGSFYSSSMFFLCTSS